ncbi:MAG: hypothetical protein VW126_00935 [Pelagibacteraceae bacterium]|jgi:hypothetical protein
MQFSLFIFLSKFWAVDLSTIQTYDFSKLPSAVGDVHRLPSFTLCAEQLAKIKNKLK